MSDTSARACPAIVLAEVLEVRLPLLKAFTTGFGTTETRRIVLVHIVDEEGHEGWGEAAALDHPYYLPETTSSAFALATEWALPLALRAGQEPFEVARALEVIRGNTFARAGVESAFWCLKASRMGCPLSELFARAVRTGRGAVGEAAVPLRSSIAAGESIGMQTTIEETIAEVELRAGEGYRRIKLKIAPGWDLDVATAARRVLGEDAMLQVDANGSYDGSDPATLEVMEGLDELGLACIEQPLSWDDLLGHAKLQERLKTPVCLDESLRSPADVRRALELGACRNVNLKPGRVGGVAASLDIHDLCMSHEIPLWCGGMLESGVGRAVNIALCALPGFSEPADMSPASVFYAWDIVEPAYEVDRDGTIAVPARAGLGFEVRADRVASQLVRRAVVEAGRSER